MDYHEIDEMVDLGPLVNVVEMVKEKVIYVENNPIK